MSTAYEMLTEWVATRDRTTGCWEWPKARHAGGYGWIRREGRSEVAHRHAVALDGRDPAGWVVRHSCNNPPCVNPDHLLLGTHADNAQDREDAGRTKRGVDLPQALLTEDDVRAIRSDNRRKQTIADEFGVSQPLVSMIQLRQRWGHVE